MYTSLWQARSSSVLYAVSSSLLCAEAEANAVPEADEAEAEDSACRMLVLRESRERKESGVSRDVMVVECGGGGTGACCAEDEEAETKAEAAEEEAVRRIGGAVGAEVCTTRADTCQGLGLAFSSLCCALRRCTPALAADERGDSGCALPLAAAAILALRCAAPEEVEGATGVCDQAKCTLTSRERTVVCRCCATHTSRNKCSAFYGTERQASHSTPTQSTADEQYMSTHEVQDKHCYQPHLSISNE
jgi:hypothetical protein